MEGTQSLNSNGASDRETGKRASWNEIIKEHFVSVLLENANSHNGHGKGWSKETWAKITNNMKMNFPEYRRLNNAEFTQQLKQLERDLKKIYKDVTHMLAQPGFTWNEIDCTLSASTDDWHRLSARDPKAGKWHGKLLPYYQCLDALYRGLLVPRATSNNGDSALLPHNSSLFTPDSVTVSSNEKMNPSHNIGLDPECEGKMNFLNFAPSKNQVLYAGSHNQREWSFEPLLLAGQNGAARVPDSLIEMCLAEYQLLGSNQADLSYVGEIFKDAKNCEAFLAFREDYKRRWLSDNIEKYREKANLK